MPPSQPKTTGHFDRSFRGIRFGGSKLDIDPAQWSNLSMSVMAMNPVLPS